MPYVDAWICIETLEFDLTELTIKLLIPFLARLF